VRPTSIDGTFDRLANVAAPLLRRARGAVRADAAALAVPHGDRVTVILVDGDATAAGFVAGLELRSRADAREPWNRVAIRHGRELVGVMVFAPPPAVCVGDPTTRAALDAIAMEVADHLANPAPSAVANAATAAAVERVDRVRRVLDDELFLMVFQPILDVRAGTTAAWEALSRFPAEPARPPQQWFREAADAGLGVALETAAARAALERLDDLPAGALLSINVSTTTAGSRTFRAALDAQPVDRVVVELNGPPEADEHFARNLRPLRDRGLRVAVDELRGGALRLDRFVTLEPDIVKLDPAATRAVENEPAARALTRAVVNLARGTPTRVAAQHVESSAQLDALTLLGVDWCQGFHLGRPAHLRD